MGLQSWGGFIMSVRLRGVAKRLRLKHILEKSFGYRAYSILRAKALNTEKCLGVIGAHLSQRAGNAGVRPRVDTGYFAAGVAWVSVKKMSLPDATEANFELVSLMLSTAEVEWWVVSNERGRPSVVGVSGASRDGVLQAFASLGGSSEVYVYRVGGPPVLRHASRADGDARLKSAPIIGVLVPRTIEGASMSYGPETACQIEFWNLDDDGLVTAPRENRAARCLSKTDFSLLDLDERPGLRIPAALAKTMLDDVVFPVDAVYTWVDGDDPVWIKSKILAKSTFQGSDFHSEADDPARYRSRDELRYSLRSLEMYAPWFRTIYVVTSGQVPDWLDTSHPSIRLVRHDEIYPDDGYLPTFNSNSIISRLHHIEGLGEHYVYINDDVFFGRALSKSDFFTPSGIAKVSISRNRRPFGASVVSDEPHLNLTRNIRHILEAEFGITISRAIKHTPHPQVRGVHIEMENRFFQDYKRTWSSRFRHHEDIVADQLHHYYAQIVGKAVPAALDYGYVNVLDDRYRNTMQEILRLRHRDTFCLNDAPVVGLNAIPSEEVSEFLERYFPVKSKFEF